MLTAPTAEFRREIERFLPPEPPPLRAVPPAEGTDMFQQSAAADLADLRAALGPVAGVEDLLSRYARVRAAGRPVR